MGNASLALLLALSLAKVEGGQNLPPLDDLWRFPRRSVCRLWIEAGLRERELARHLYYRLPSPTDRVFEAYSNRIAQATNAWDELAHAWDESLPAERRRWHLEQLRILIGESAYFCGYLPPPLELDFFYLDE